MQILPFCRRRYIPEHQAAGRIDEIREKVTFPITTPNKIRSCNRIAVLWQGTAREECSVRLIQEKISCGSIRCKQMLPGRKQSDGRICPRKTIGRFAFDHIAPLCLAALQQPCFAMADLSFLLQNRLTPQHQAPGQAADFRSNPVRRQQDATKSPSLPHPEAGHTALQCRQCAFAGCQFLQLLQYESNRQNKVILWMPFPEFPQRENDYDKLPACPHTGEETQKTDPLQHGKHKPSGQTLGKFAHNGCDQTFRRWDHCELILRRSCHGMCRNIHHHNFRQVRKVCCAGNTPFVFIGPDSRWRFALSAVPRNGRPPVLWLFGGWLPPSPGSGYPPEE